MSRIGRKPIALVPGVRVSLVDRKVDVVGPKGALSLDMVPEIKVREESGYLIVERSSDDRNVRAKHGLTRKLIANMVTGVTSGFEKRLEIVGTGFKAEVTPGELRMTLGYSHAVVIPIPKGIDIQVEKQVKIAVRGIDAQQVGQVAALIMNSRVPDAYKGKGIQREGVVFKGKPGKQAAK